MSAQHRLEAVHWQTIDVLGGLQHGQHSGADHALFDLFGRHVSDDWSGFATTAAIDFAHVFEHTNLHRHDIALFAGFLANHVVEATTGASQLVLGQVMNDFNVWQVSRQWYAFATLLGWRYDFFFGIKSARMISV